MGRATCDAIIAMDFSWPHAERHTVVATTRPLVDAPPGVSPAAGTIDELIAISKDHAGAKDIYLDGGDLIRQSLDRSLVDEIIVTLCPIVLGAGIPLFAGTSRRHQLKLRKHELLPGGLVQLTYAPDDSLPAV